MEIEPVAKSCSKTVGRAVFLSGEDVTWYSTNKLLGSYRYATGLKTGSTDEAGPCLAASAEKDGRSLWRFCSNRPTLIRATTMRPRFFTEGFAYVETFLQNGE